MGGCTAKTIKTESKKPLIENEGIINAYSNFRDTYEFVCYLSRGRYGCIRLFCKIGQPKMLYAIKTICKEFYRSEVISNCLRIDIPEMCKLDHPNIGKVYEAYEESGYYHVVMEYVKGSNLYKMVINRKSRTLRATCEIFFGILRAVNYIHNKGLMHKDIKPENIIFGKPGVFSTLKLVDFGFSQSYIIPKVSFNFQNSQFMSPEFLKGEANQKSDLWSVGIIFYILVTGVFPYYGAENLEQALKEGDYNTEPLLNKNICDELRDLIFKLLKANPNHRINSSEALDHPFFSLLNYQDCLIDEDVFKSIREFSMKNQVEKEILYHLAFCNTDNELEKLRESFEQLDPNNSGVINYEDFQFIFEKIVKKSSKEIEEAWKGLDFHMLGKVDYSQFLAATLKNLEFIKEERIQNIFNIFDVDNSGFISKENFLEILSKKGDLKEIEYHKLSEIISFFEERISINYSQFKELIGYH